MRINKYLALCGVASRRKVEEYIVAGKIKVNGIVCTNLATDIKETDEVLYNNKKVNTPEFYEYYMINKPKGYVCTVHDDRNRKVVVDLIKSDVRLFPVGRLDYDSEGLLILTNDGDLTYKLTHPKHEISKTYNASIEGELSMKEIKYLESGITIDDNVKLRPCKIEKKWFKENTTRVEITIFEGKNREIRKMFDKIKKPVAFLKRVKIGELKLGGLNRGEYRPLTKAEVEYLKSL
ncbi:MAG: rRNA pseudouridine synthase [Clostridiales bacterium]|nr:rRNA pseudouridine synthase [Candidatus Apopatousia equi]